MGAIIAAAVMAVAPTAPLSAQASDLTGDPIADLLAYRASVLTKRSTAITVGVASIEALHQQRVDRLGYEPGTTDPREIARQMMLNRYGWGAEQFACYDKIIMRESRWNPYADNPHSSAYGIPQALPGKKMASFGSDWRTNPATQIAWGLWYVKDRYGTPCHAWGFKASHGWY